MIQDPNIFHAADYSQAGEDTPKQQAAMAARDRIRVLESVSGLEHRRRWDPNTETYTVERIPPAPPHLPR